MKKSRASFKKMDRGGLSPEEIAKYESSMNEAANKKKKVTSLSLNFNTLDKT